MGTARWVGVRRKGVVERSPETRVAVKLGGRGGRGRDNAALRGRISKGNEMKSQVVGKECEKALDSWREGKDG